MVKRRAVARVRPGRYASQLEADFAMVLQADLERGDIIDWSYEPEKFRLAKKTWYCPDFRTIGTNGAITFYEVKGSWRAPHQDDSRVKLKTCAELHWMYRFVAVTRRRKADPFTYEEMA